MYPVRIAHEMTYYESGGTLTFAHSLLLRLS